MRALHDNRLKDMVRLRVELSVSDKQASEIMAGGIWQQTTIVSRRSRKTAPNYRMCCFCLRLRQSQTNVSYAHVGRAVQNSGYVIPTPCCSG